MIEERSASVYEDEIQRRQSAVDIKGFIQEEKDRAYVDTTDIDASAMEEEKGVERPSRKRALSFSGIQEDVFLAKLPVVEDLNKEEAEELIRRGQLPEESVDTLKLLLQQ